MNGVRARIEALMREVGQQEDAGDGFLTHVYDELYAIVNIIEADTGCQYPFPDGEPCSSPGQGCVCEREADA